MIKRLLENINGNNSNYILPFFWMHCEGIEAIREEMEKVYECGIREICIESRPHPDFMGASWWEEMDFIFEEANRRNMRVWLLDDDKFPTGHARGEYQKKPELAKLYLAERHMDVLGPMKDCAVAIEPFLGRDGIIEAVLACPKPDTKSLAVSGENALDLTANVHDGVVYFDVPVGFHRVFVIYTSRKNGGRENYMNLIDTESVRFFIDTIYEPHYERYKQYFGNVFAGFFSDEPEFGNTKGYDFNEKLGKRDVKLPWSNELRALLAKKWQGEFKKLLPALWYEMGAKTGAVRTDFMDMATRLVDRCFCSQVGKWCEQHGVEYIGHIIEDDNAHGRLGCSIGNFFRAQQGQHMSGIDVVLLQIMPGFKETYHQWIASDRDGEFFHYGLAKLGSSLAHIDPIKKGRAMCEIFGAYGWAEGVSLMKWLTDHMLVNGINVFVPHAFSMTFPDRDCPPHFYARGNNPQYRFFAYLMRYMNRVSHLLNGGLHTADAAVLYHADAEWSGGKTMPFQKPVRALQEAQLDCDIIPCDLLEKLDISDGKFEINGVLYSSFIIPYCEKIPETVLNFVGKAAKNKISVYVIDSLPDTTVHDEKIPFEFKDSVAITSLEKLAENVRSKQETVFKPDKEFNDLRACCYRHDDGIVYMFFNESVFDSVETNIKSLFLDDNESSIFEYDALRNTCKKATVKEGTIKVKLLPGEAKIFVSGKMGENIGKDAGKNILEQEIPILCDWEVSTATALEYPVFKFERTFKKGEELINMNGKEGIPRFAGTFRYYAKFNITLKEGLVYFLDFPGLNDCAEIFINSKLADMLICAPYKTDITRFVVEGENEIIVDVTNTLVWQLHDGQSTHMQLLPTGLTKPPVLQIFS